MNVSSWNGATGNWRKAADWSNGVPDAATEADFTASGTYTVTYSRSEAFAVGAVNFNAAGATLALRGSLTLGGIFDLKAGTLAMSSGGVIHGGTLMIDGGALTSTYGSGSKSGRLDGVTLGGVLDLSAPVETLNITNGLTGVAGGGAQIRLTGGENELLFRGSQTIDNVTIVFENSSSYSVVYGKGVLTIGPSATVTTTAFGPLGVLTASAVINNGAIVSAASGALGTFNLSANRYFVNNGAITAASDIILTSPRMVNGTAGTLDVGEFINFVVQGSFLNRGLVMIAASGDFDVSSDTTIANAGTISVGSGNLSLDQSTGPGVVVFTNTGAITVGQQGSLSLLLNFTVASLGNIVDAGRFYLGGTLDNTGQTLRLGTGPIFGGVGTTLGDGGLISGGTMVLGGAPLVYTGGGLINVTLQGVVDLSVANASLNLDGGVVVTGANGSGPGVINLTGAGATLYFFDATGTVRNGIDNVTINAGNARAADSIVLENFNFVSEALTLGARATIVSSARGAQVAVQTLNAPGSTIVNDGHIDAAASGGSFQVTMPTLENDGQIVVSNGDSFTLVGALTGTGQFALATGGTAVLGATAAGQNVAFSDATGTLTLSSAASFAATLSGAIVGDRIDLLNTAATTAAVNAKDQLVVTSNGARVATIQLAGDYAHTAFKVAGDGHGGSLITLANAPAMHAIAWAMASLGGAAGAASVTQASAGTGHAPTLVRPAAC